MMKRCSLLGHEFALAFFRADGEKHALRATRDASYVRDGSLQQRSRRLQAVRCAPAAGAASAGVPARGDDASSLKRSRWLHARAGPSAVRAATPDDAPSHKRSRGSRAGAGAGPTAAA